MNWNRFMGAVFALMVVLSVGANRLPAQSTTTGDITGVVTDPSNAVVPDAKVALKDNAKGYTQDTKSNKDGIYHFFLLSPGSYTLTVSASGFKTSFVPVEVNIGQVSTFSVQLALGVATQTVTVTEAAPLLQAENGNVANTLNYQQVQNLPNPGNDLSYIAQTAPGVVMNTQAGYGNFSANGLPGNSNLFTINGMDNNDPYLNLNNSGATNLMLGQNEVQEATVVSNGYSGQFGTLAGANINYVTKSGGNDYHGRAIYYWNGRTLNAESWLTKNSGAPRPFSNANQWGGDAGGPIKKDKLFWYANTEGLRVLLPTSTEVFVPTPDFEVSTLNNLVANGLSASVPFYCQNITITSPHQGSFTCPAAGPAPNIPGQVVRTVGQGIFNLFNTAPGVQRANLTSPSLTPGVYCDNSSNASTLPAGCSLAATASFPTGLGCSNYPGLGVGAAALPCAQSFRSGVGNLTTEWTLSARIDYNYGPNDRVFIRAESDRGNQATYTDPINALFNASSFQPEYQGQLIETHTFNSTTVNQFILSGTWYSAIFTNGNRSGALNAFPTTLYFAGDGSLGAQSGSFPFQVGGGLYDFPQGRNVTQYQIQDDVSKTRGNHAVKFGVKFKRYDYTDHGFQNRLVGRLIPLSLDDFAWGGTGNDGAVPGTAGGDANSNGGATILQQRFPTAVEQPFAYYQLGAYVEDGWRIRPNLTITGALRLEHPSNVICRHLCFAESNPWFSLTHSGSIPYNQVITTGVEQFLPFGFQNLEWQPRVSFAWQPFGTSRNTVIRGGIGIFYDGFQSSLANNFAINPPNSNRFNPLGDNLAPTETTGNLFIDTAAINNAFVTGFITGQTRAQIIANIAATNPTAAAFFSPPNLTSSDRFTNAPQYQKWSLEWQQQLDRNDVVGVQYVGNHGIHELIRNAGVNCHRATFACTRPLGAPSDPRFNVAEVEESSGLSNYNGLIVTFKRQFSSGIVNFNYAYSKAMDMSEGLDPFNFNTNLSIEFQEDPLNLRRNYGPADWDATHYISANYVWELPVRKAFFGHGWKQLVEGWQVSGTVFYRTGLPYTVIDGVTDSSLSSRGYGSQVFGNFSGTSLGQAYIPCGSGSGSPDTCLNPALFSRSPTGFGNLGRNSLRGPHFFDTDFTVIKKTKIPGWERGELGIGFQFFNVFNHANFDQANQDVSSGSFGATVAQVASPTSILGSFLGGDNSPRIIQLKAQFTF